MVEIACKGLYMLLYKRAIPDRLRAGPPMSAGKKITPQDESPRVASTNQFAEYACGRPNPKQPVKYMRRAPANAPELYGLQDDQTLVAIWEHLELRDGHKHRRLSKQLKRVCTRALEKKLSLSPEQAVAFADAMAGRNVFLTGGAGVGKSHTLTQIVKYLKEETYAVTASTGCAAALIGAATLHSTMGIGIGTMSAKQYAIKISKNAPLVYQRMRRIKTLILDECSMMDGATFNKAGLVAAMLRRNCPEDQMNNTAAFTLWDGMQIICCGDFMQLPPVQAKENGWIFDSRAWKQLGFRNHVLTCIHRQSGDPTFAEVLARVRFGHATEVDVRYLKQNSAPAEPENCLKLFAINKPADALNESKFNALIGQTLGAQGLRTFENVPHTFTAIDWAIKPEKLGLLANCQAPPKLYLCRHARVMCLRNLIPGQLVNGSTGTVRDITPIRDGPNAPVTGASITVVFDGMLDQQPFTHVFRTYESTLPESQVAKDLEFSVHEGKKKVASRIQIPLRLAWAVSIHKSQGMSLERASIDFKGVFEFGQAYTALSRMRTLAGAYLQNLQFAHLRMASDKARKWYESLAVEEWSRA
jgi:ATP-dependent DNA helicase PIF1